jgi:hypothetical protein
VLASLESNDPDLRASVIREFQAWSDAVDIFNTNQEG